MSYWWKLLEKMGWYRTLTPCGKRRLLWRTHLMSCEECFHLWWEE